MWLCFGRGGGGCIFGGVFYFMMDMYEYFIIVSNMGLCVTVKVSVIYNLCLNYIYVHVESFKCIPFRYVVFLMFGCLCHLCVLCRVYVERIWGSV
jgi:hypothetical protein